MYWGAQVNGTGIVVQDTRTQSLWGVGVLYVIKAPNVSTAVYGTWCFRSTTQCFRAFLCDVYELFCGFCNRVGNDLELVHSGLVLTEFRDGGVSLIPKPTYGNIRNVNNDQGIIPKDSVYSRSVGGFTVVYTVGECVIL